MLRSVLVLVVASAAYLLGWRRLALVVVLVGGGVQPPEDRRREHTPRTHPGEVVNLAKRRGFVFPSAEIYGGFRSTWDYGPVGVLLLRNVKQAWWRSMVQLRTDVVGLDAAILTPPVVFEARYPRRRSRSRRHRASADRSCTSAAPTCRCRRGRLPDRPRAVPQRRPPYHPDVLRISEYWADRIGLLLDGVTADRHLVPEAQSIDVRFDDSVR